MSADPLGGNPANPESLNRYANVVNNPGTLNDPSGMYPLYPVEAPCEGGWCDPFQLAFGGGMACGVAGDCEQWWGIDAPALDLYLLLMEDDLGNGGDGLRVERFCPNNVQWRDASGHVIEKSEGSELYYVFFAGRRIASIG